MPDTFGGEWRRPKNPDRGHKREIQDRVSYDNEPERGCGGLFLLCVLAVAAVVGVVFT